MEIKFNLGGVCLVIVLTFWACTAIHAHYSIKEKHSICKLVKND